MSGNEVISIHLGSYANFTGAHLWNLDYARALHGMGIDDCLESDRDSNVCTRSQVNPGILFRETQSRRGQSSESLLQPRAVFCDHAGSVPERPAPATAARSRHHTYEDVSSEIKWNSTWNVSFTSHGAMERLQTRADARLGATREVASASEEIQAERDTLVYAASWIGQMRMNINPRSVALAPAGFNLPLACDLFAHGSKLGSSLGFSSSGVGNNNLLDETATYHENIIECIRWQAEDCDRPQALRVIVDADSAWGGLAVDLLNELRDQYRSLITLVFPVSVPIAVQSSTPSSALPHVWSRAPYAPFATESEYFAREDGSDAVTVLSSSDVAVSHLRRASNMAQLLANIQESATLIAPLAMPHVPSILTQLATAAARSRSNPSYLYPELADCHNIAALTSVVAKTISPSLVYQHLTGAIFAHAVHSALAPMTLPRIRTALTADAEPEGATDILGNDIAEAFRKSTAATIPISTLINTLCPRPKLNVAGFGFALPAHSRLNLLQPVIEEGNSRETRQADGILPHSESETRSAGLTMLTPLILVPDDPRVSVSAKSPNAPTGATSRNIRVESATSRTPNVQAIDAVLSNPTVLGATNQESKSPASPDRLIEDLGRLTNWSVASGLDLLARSAMGGNSRQQARGVVDASNFLRSSLYSGYYMGGQLASESKSSYESNFQAQIFKGKYMAKYPRCSTAIVDPVVTNLQVGNRFPYPSSNLVRVLNGFPIQHVPPESTEEARMVADVRVTALRAATITDIFTARAFLQGFKALQQRAKEARRNPVLATAHTAADYVPDDWAEVDNALNTLAEEYLME